jgi:MFS family permease
MSMLLPGRVLPLAPGTFRALRHRDFRLLWLGQVVSLTGSWMQSTAQGWLVLRLSDSAFYLGLIGFCTFAPIMLFALVAGVAADRLPRRATLLWTQTASTFLALALTFLTWTGMVEVWHVAVLAFGLGTAAAFDIPVRQSFLQDLVGREDLPNAIALNSLAFNGARLVGPAVGGVMVAALGEAPCFLVNAVSFGAVIAAIAAIRARGEAAPSRREESWLAGIRDGLAFARRTTLVRVLLGLVVVSSIFGMPYTILMPVFARDVLDVGSRGLGFLMGAAGLGAMIGALYVAGRKSVRRSGPVVAWSIGIFGSALIAFSLSRSFAVAIPFLVVVGGAMITQLSTSNALLQLNAPEEMRGRVVSLYMLCFIGMAPIGSLLSGAMARWIGAPLTVGVGGAVCVLAGAWLGLRLPVLRARSGGPGQRSRISTS